MINNKWDNFIDNLSESQVEDYTDEIIKFINKDKFSSLDYLSDDYLKEFGVTLSKDRQLCVKVDSQVREFDYFGEFVGEQILLNYDIADDWDLKVQGGKTYIQFEAYNLELKVENPWELLQLFIKSIDFEYIDDFDDEFDDNLKELFKNKKSLERFKYLCQMSDEMPLVISYTDEKELEKLISDLEDSCEGYKISYGYDEDDY